MKQAITTSRTYVKYLFHSFIPYSSKKKNLKNVDQKQLEQYLDLLYFSVLDLGNVVEKHHNNKIAHTTTELDNLMVQSNRKFKLLKKFIEQVQNRKEAGSCLKPIEMVFLFSASVILSTAFVVVILKFF